MEDKRHKKYHSMCERCYEVPCTQADMRSVAIFGLCSWCEWEEGEGQYE